MDLFILNIVDVQNSVLAMSPETQKAKHTMPNLTYRYYVVRTIIKINFNIIIVSIKKKNISTFGIVGFKIKLLMLKNK